MGVGITVASGMDTVHTFDSMTNRGASVSSAPKLLFHRDTPVFSLEPSSHSTSQGVFLSLVRVVLLPG